MNLANSVEVSTGEPARKIIDMIRDGVEDRL
jgi:hypothetical protein